MRTFIISTIISFAITAVWYMVEYEQFGELKWDRKCDAVAWCLYWLALCVGFSKW